MSVHKPLHMTEYLVSHPHNVNVTFSFPDGSQLGANRMLLAASCQTFQAMFYRDWKEETVIHLPDSNKEAFEFFTRILYREAVELYEADLLSLEKLYYLADKYMVEEIKKNITEAAKYVSYYNTTVQEDLLNLEHVMTDPIKEIVAT